MQRIPNLSTFSVVLVVALCLLYAGASVLFASHNDIGWHLAAGDLILEKGVIPQTDPWSHTADGHPWLNVAWLWDVAATACLFAEAGLYAREFAGAPLELNRPDSTFMGHRGFCFASTAGLAEALR